MIEKISLDLIDDFNNHPFKVVEDESLKELADSINENGLLEPWWKSDDSDNFKKEINDVKKYFNEMSLENGSKLYGELVKAEAMADLTAVSCCLALLNKQDNADYKMFFESFTSSREEIYISFS